MQDRRIATESAEEREARLQQLWVAQQQRIATETSEEIESRRARDRRNHMDLKTAEVPLFQQTRVCFKMRQFHSRLKSVCVPRCVTKVSMHLSISHSLCSAVHNYDSLCRRSSRSPINAQHCSSNIIIRIIRTCLHARTYTALFGHTPPSLPSTGIPRQRTRVRVRARSRTRHGYSWYRCYIFASFTASFAALMVAGLILSAKGPLGLGSVGLK